METRAATPLPAAAPCPLCALRSRRRFAGWLLAGAAGAGLGSAARAQDGLRGEVGGTSRFTRFVSAEQVEAAAAQQYQQLLQQAASKRALGPPDHPQVVRLRAIAHRIQGNAGAWNPRAVQWRWEVNLIGSRELNAFCMPGGKIAFFMGLLQKLQLEDDEVAAVMGHEVAHALREHARERIGKTMVTRGAVEIGSLLFGLGNAGRMVGDLGGQLLTLKFSRDDETEADVVGMELAARAGYDPAAGVTLWQKMATASKGAPPQWLSTHPAGADRMREIRNRLPQVEPLYRQAAKPSRSYGPPPA